MDDFLKRKRLSDSRELPSAKRNHPSIPVADQKGALAQLYVAYDSLHRMNGNIVDVEAAVEHFKVLLTAAQNADHGGAVQRLAITLVSKFAHLFPDHMTDATSVLQQEMSDLSMDAPDQTTENEKVVAMQRFLLRSTALPHSISSIEHAALTAIRPVLKLRGQQPSNDMLQTVLAAFIAAPVQIFQRLLSTAMHNPAIKNLIQSCIIAPEHLALHDITQSSNSSRSSVLADYLEDQNFFITQTSLFHHALRTFHVTRSNQEERGIGIAATMASRIRQFITDNKEFNNTSSSRSSSPTKESFFKQLALIADELAPVQTSPSPGIDATTTSNSREKGERDVDIDAYGVDGDNTTSYEKGGVKIKSNLLKQFLIDAEEGELNEADEEVAVLPSHEDNGAVEKELEKDRERNREKFRDRSRSKDEEGYDYRKVHHSSRRSTSPPHAPREHPPIRPRGPRDRIPAHTYAREMPPLSLASESLWVGQVPVGYSAERNLVEAFSQCGRLVSHRIIAKSCCAFFNFATKEDAINARRKMDGETIAGNMLVVEFKHERKYWDSLERSGDGNNYGDRPPRRSRSRTRSRSPGGASRAQPYTNSAKERKVHSNAPPLPSSRPTSGPEHLPLHTTASGMGGKTTTSNGKRGKSRSLTPPLKAGAASGSNSWHGILAKQRQPQAEVMCIPTISGPPKSWAGVEPAGWPESLDVANRIPTSYVCDTLLQSLPPRDRAVLRLLPAPGKPMEVARLGEFAAYLHGKERTGVVELGPGPQPGAPAQRVLYLIPADEKTCMSVGLPYDGNTNSMLAVVAPKLH